MSKIRTVRMAAVQITAILSLMAIGSAWGGSAARAEQITVPPAGTSMRWDCDSKWNDSYETTIVEVGNDKVKWDLNWSSDGSGDGISDV